MHEKIVLIFLRSIIIISGIQIIASNSQLLPCNGEEMRLEKNEISGGPFFQNKRTKSTI